MKPHSRIFAAVLALAVIAGAARAQDNPVPCKGAPCILMVDWGPGKTSASYPPDRRYGGADDFESRFRGAMGARGYLLRDGPIEGATTITIRPTMKSKVMCDVMAGMNPDMTCTAITGLSVAFISGDPKVKAPGALRVTNRCAAGDIFMLNKNFGQYSADMIWYQLEGQAAKAERPNVNC